MPDFEQIDREKTTYVKAANKALQSLLHCGYRWWNYSVSHCTFSLLVGDASAQQNNVVISLAACEYISGPVDWIKQQELEIIFNCDRTKQHNVWEFIVQDESSGFKAIAGIFEWRKNFNLLNI